jgi:hypothetical protein
MTAELLELILSVHLHQLMTVNKRLDLFLEV